ncbi:MAG: regulatory signaling modulator protein AmpE [Gammaproteobacteria bacterium]|jgi:AmpE protein
MNLIAVLLCITLQKVINVAGNIKQSLFQFYLAKTNPLLVNLNGYLALALLVLPFAVLIGLLHFLTLGYLSGFIHLLFVTLILFFCIDARDMERGVALSAYLQAMDKDQPEQAINAGETFVGEHITAGHSLARTVTKVILTRSFTNIFAPLFWFAIADVYGVFIYYLLVHLQENASREATYVYLVRVTTTVLTILNWLPMRLLALIYALAGHFVNSFSHSYKEILSSSASFDHFVVDAALRATDMDVDKENKSSIKENRAVLSLVNRVLLIWVIALVLLTLGKWFA